MATATLHDDDSHIIDDNLEILSLIWLDTNFENVKGSRSTEQKLRNVINNIITCH